MFYTACLCSDIYISCCDFYNLHYSNKITANRINQPAVS